MSQISTPSAASSVIANAGSVGQGPDKGKIDAITDNSLQKDPTAVALASQLQTIQQQFEATKKELESLRAEREGLQKISDATKVAFSKETVDPNVQLEKQKVLWRHAGYTDAEIENAIAEVRAEEQAAKGAGGAGKGGGTAQGGGPDAKTLKVLEDLQAQQKVLQQTVQQQVTGLLEESTRGAVREDPSLKAFYAYVKERDGEQAANNLLKSWEGEVMQGVKRAVSQDIDEKGRLDLAFAKAASQQVAAALAGRVQAYLGEPKNLGRVRGVATGEDPFASLEKMKPVERPLWEPGVQPGDLEKKVTDRLADSLSRASARLQNTVRI